MNASTMLSMNGISISFQIFSVRPFGKLRAGSELSLRALSRVEGSKDSESVFQHLLD
jgi:hypothetical protein